LPFDAAQTKKDFGCCEKVAVPRFFWRAAPQKESAPDRLDRERWLLKDFPRKMGLVSSDNDPA
jgi:hypothetical protein